MVQIGTVPLLDLTEYATYMIIGLCGSYIQVGKSLALASEQQPGFQQMQQGVS